MIQIKADMLRQEAKTSSTANGVLQDRFFLENINHAMQKN